MEEKKESKQTIKGFGYEWTKWGNIKNLYRDESELIWEFNRYGIPDEFFKGKIVLDAGCGMGRYSYVAVSKKNPKIIYSIDPGDGVENAKKLEERYKNIKVKRANIFNLPFKDNFFDSIMSIGVLHHTGNTEKAFQILAKKLKKGGKLFVMLYDYPVWYKKLWFIFIRFFTTKMNQKFLYSYCRFWCALKFIPRWIKYALTGYKIQKYERNVADTFDWYCCPHQDFMSRQEIIDMYKRNGFKDITVTNKDYPRTGNVVIGTKI